MNIDSKLDLTLKRELNITPEEAFKGWTTPELICKWFCPEPWKVVESRVDLRPGGEFYTVMQSPEGQKFPNTGRFLEVIPNRKLVWTSALLPDFRPAPAGGMAFTGVIELEPTAGGKTRYTAHAIHMNEEDRNKHAEMGFEQGRGICADQLVKLMKSL